MNGGFCRLTHPRNILKLTKHNARENKTPNGNRSVFAITAKKLPKKHTKRNEFGNLRIVVNSRNGQRVRADSILPFTTTATHRRTSLTRKGAYTGTKNVLSLTLQRTDSECKLNTPCEKRESGSYGGVADGLRLHELMFRPDCSLCLKGSPKELCSKEESDQQKKLKLQNKVNAGTGVDQEVGVSKCAFQEVDRQRWSVRPKTRVTPLNYLSMSNRWVRNCHITNLSINPAAYLLNVWRTSV